VDRLFKLKVDGVEYRIDLRGNGMLVDDVPFVIGTQGEMVTVDGIAFDVALDEQHASMEGLEYAIELEGVRLKHTKNKLNLEPELPLGGPGAVVAMMPGAIVRIGVEVGQSVEVGDVLLILEAMKMENDIQAERSGVISKVHVSPGDRVITGQALVDIE
jgi:biotin carboxyl carrier protein